MVEASAEFDSRKWALLGCVYGLPVYALGAWLGHPDKGELAAGSVAMLVLVGTFFSRNRRSPWYWAALTIAVLYHLVGVVFIQYGKLAGPAVLVFWPYAMGDLLILLALFNGAAKFASLAAKQRSP